MTLDDAYPILYAHTRAHKNNKKEVSSSVIASWRAPERAPVTKTDEVG
jgi:hypothetical protein